MFLVDLDAMDVFTSHGYLCACKLYLAYRLTINRLYIDYVRSLVAVLLTHAPLLSPLYELSCKLLRLYFLLKVSRLLGAISAHPSRVVCQKGIDSLSLSFSGGAVGIMIGFDKILPQIII